MRPLSTVQPITQRLVHVIAIAEPITGVTGPLELKIALAWCEWTFIPVTV